MPAYKGLNDDLQGLLEQTAPPGSAGRAVVARLSEAGMESASLSLGGAKARASPDSSFLAYSLTKSFSAAAALRLCASGELTLDAPLERWAPDFPHASRITLRMLLQHTSGLPDYGALPDYHEAVRSSEPAWTDSEFLARTHADALRFPPGRGWGYSNIGYLLVRRLLERVRTESLQSVFDAEIFAPLGLRRTFVASDDDLSRLVFGPSAYLGSADAPADVASRYSLGWVAPGAIASTAEDIARFYHGLFRSKLLPEPLLAEMRRPHLLDAMPGRPFVRPGYGLGLQVDADAPGGAFWGHSGGGPGASAAAAHRPEATGATTVAVLTDGEDVAQAERLMTAALAGNSSPDAV